MQVDFLPGQERLRQREQPRGEEGGRPPALLQQPALHAGEQEGGVGVRGDGGGEAAGGGRGDWRDQRDPGVPGAGRECEEGGDQSQREGGAHQTHTVVARAEGDFKHRNIFLTQRLTILEI